MLGLIGKKIGMTQIFDEGGNLVPITAVKIEPNVVVGHRTEEKNGYTAVILGAFAAKVKNVTKPVQGQFPDKTAPTKVMREFRGFDKECEIGDTLGVDLFEGVRYVDVQASSKGKGYQGVIKRHGFHGGNKTHGSKFHRAPGSTGMAAWPSRVIKGTKMPGRMGTQKTTIQNLDVVRIDTEKGLLLIGGSVPGPRGSVVLVKTAKKH